MSYVRLFVYYRKLHIELFGFKAKISQFRYASLGAGNYCFL